MAPTLLTTLRSIVSAVPPASVESRSDSGLGSPEGPLVEAIRLFGRKDDKSDDYHGPDPSKGVLDPHDISNVGFFVLFALIGVGFIVTGIWFFFWARNGGFHFKENDWDDYKSTVLRRKGPNGTLLSGATPSTNLGGGSVFKDVVDDDGTVVTENTALSGITAGASDIGAREKRRKKQEKRDREKRKRRNEKRHVGEYGVEDDVAEDAAKKELRSYRHERPARVGGLNRQADSSAFDGSTNHSQTQGSTEASGSTVESELLSNRQSTPTSTPTGTPTKKREDKDKKSTPAIRKVYSTADRNAEREAERIRAEARRLREEGRTARRDFSYQRGGAAESALSESLLESSVDGSDLGTKSYHHPMPELREEGQREQRQREREERRARRGGYRRGRGDDDGI